MLTPDDKRYYDNFLDLFQHDGWKQFIEDNLEVKTSIDLHGAKNWDDFIEMRTELEVRDLIASFEEGIRQVLHDLNHPEEDTEEDV